MFLIRVFTLPAGSAIGGPCSYFQGHVIRVVPEALAMCQVWGGGWVEGALRKL